MDEKKNRKESTAFSLHRGELLCALLLYPAAYIYTLAMDGPKWQLWFGLFVLAFVALGEWINRGRPRMAESWVWLGCLLMITLCIVIGRGRAWGELSALLAHPLAVWWLLSRSGALLEGESGHLLPLDAVNGFIRVPFGNFFLRLHCLGQGLRNWRRGRESGRGRFFAALLAVAAALVLLNRAAVSLARADVLFGALAENVLKFFRFDLNEGFTEFVVRFLLSLPIGAWLFGLIAGSARMERDKLRAQAAAVNGFLPKLRLVPSRVWTVCMAGFVLLYLLFFAVQFRYLFGAFTRTLPEGFIVSQYAREGFFELCRVMAINFSLLYLVSRSGAMPIREDKAQRIFCTLLLAAGVLFAVIAFSKLALYISCFGFTPKRLQSCWLVLVLFAASAACLYSLWSGKRSFKAWLMFSAVSLALLHLY